ncbi:MAG: hypothetical protein RMJ59_05590 [Candidatus Nitrosocaldus sp.]|nr:hypothetical protein [Candidatus Nitrosocaldus sp.]MDW8275835.1 hypothetical protein [Candidatus Nitrosocaldus sp.]
MSALSMVALALLEAVILTNTSPSTFRLAYIIAPIITAPIVLAVAWKRSLATVIMAIGLLCILGSMMLLPHMLTMGSISKDRFYIISLRSFLLGVAMVAISMIMVYRPELLYVRNRPRDDGEGGDGMKVWDERSRSRSRSSMAGSTLLIPLRRLLDDRESMLLPVYRYVLVIIDGITYLVPPDEYVPVGSVVVRGSDGMFVGVRKAL